MTELKTEAPLKGASFLTDVLCRLRKEREFLAELTKEDIFLEDGTLVMAGASHLPTLEKLDKTIEIFNQRLTLLVGAR